MATRKGEQEPSAWKEFATVSRAVLRSARGGPARSPRGGGVRARGTTSIAQATAQALKLGRAQAEFVLGQRRTKQEQRTRAVEAARRRAAKRARAAPQRRVPASPLTPALARESRGLLVAEGDSWFDYPFYDVLKDLDDAFGWDVEQVSHRGDTVECMAYDGGQLEDFVRTVERVIRRGQVPTAILLSGGGNDVSGDGFSMLLDHRSSPVFGLNPAVLQGLVETRIRIAYTTILSAVTRVSERLLGLRVPVLVHGYDYPVPDGRGFLGGFGPLPGPWLDPGFREKGYDDLAERVEVMRTLIDRFYAMLEDVVKTPGFGHVEVVDLRGTLSIDLSGDRYQESWGNELHPTRAGFNQVARKFDEHLR
jgi:lysophospholipase L1-like esterase